MFKFILLIVIFCFLQTGEGTGAWSNKTEADDYIKDLANWSLQYLDTSTSTTAIEHKILQISNIRTQIVDGTNVEFTLELLTVLPYRQYEVYNLN